MKVISAADLGRTIFPLPKPYRGPQWRVTNNNSLIGDRWYVIESHRIKDQDWFDHMRHKNWVDIGDFASALANARNRKEIRSINQYVRKKYPQEQWLFDTD